MKTQCPHCNQLYEVESHFSGTIAKCENCGQEFVIDPLKEEPPPQLRKVPVAAATQAKPVAKSKTKKKMIFAAAALVVLALLGAAYFQGSRWLAYKQAQAAWEQAELECEQAELELEDIKKQYDIERQRDLGKDQTVLAVVHCLGNEELSHLQAWKAKNALDNAGIDWRGLGLRLDEYSGKIIVSNLAEFHLAFEKQQYLAEIARLEQKCHAIIKKNEALTQAIQLFMELNISEKEKAESQRQLRELAEGRKLMQEHKENLQKRKERVKEFSSIPLDTRQNRAMLE